MVLIEALRCLFLYIIFVHVPLLHKLIPFTNHLFKNLWSSSNKYLEIGLWNLDQNRIFVNASHWVLPSISLTHELLESKLVISLMDADVQDLLLCLAHTRIEMSDALLLTDGLHWYVSGVGLLDKESWENLLLGSWSIYELLCAFELSRFNQIERVCLVMLLLVDNLTSATCDLFHVVGKATQQRVRHPFEHLKIPQKHCFLLKYSRLNFVLNLFVIPFVKDCEMSIAVTCYLKFGCSFLIGQESKLSKALIRAISMHHFEDTHVVELPICFLSVILWKQILACLVQVFKIVVLKQRFGVELIQKILIWLNCWFGRKVRCHIFGVFAHH